MLFKEFLQENKSADRIFGELYFADYDTVYFCSKDKLYLFEYFSMEHEFQMLIDKENGRYINCEPVYLDKEVIRTIVVEHCHCKDMYVYLDV